MAKSPEALCADKNAEKETTVAIECFQSDCENFAECLVKVEQSVSRATGKNVPRCETGDIAYEASNEGMRTIWCVHDDGVPHGPWHVWEEDKKRVDGMYKEGKQDGSWSFYHDDRTETQRYVNGEYIRNESNDAMPAASTNDKPAQANDLSRLSLRPPDAGSPPSSQVIPTTILELGPIQALDKSDTALDAMAKRIQAKYFPGIKRCHQRALKTDPKLSGQITIGMTVGMTGRVTDAAVSGFEPTVDACVRSQAQRWRFAAPKYDGKPVAAKFRVPLTMALQGQHR
ncbi:MAG: energy transducer TonB [Kofleriaceae bacterium]|nr:energy transducer TonB [Kofleriaceae bacterium]